MIKRKNRVQTPSGWSILGVLAGLSLFLVAYHNTLSWFFERAVGADSYYSHLPLVPIISGYLIWRQRAVFEKRKEGYSVFGLVLILFAVCLHLASELFDVRSTSGFSVLVLVFGLSLFLLGRQATRRILFPLSFLIFMVPLPGAVLDAVGVPMKLFATASGARTMEFLGIPVVQEGFQLHFVSASLVVGNPCSGLRSLIALMALGALYANIYDGKMWKRVTLFLASIPIAFFSNIARVAALSLVTNSYGSDAATGVFHDLSGLSVFVVALLLLLGFGRLLDWIPLRHVAE